MSDIALHTTSFGTNEDRSWLASSHGTEATRSGTLDVSTLTSGTHFASGGGIVKSGTALGRNSSSGLWEPFSHVDGNAEVQTLTRTSTGGTVTLTFDGATTGTITATSGGFTASAVQTALEALPNIQPGDVTVTGSAGGPLTVTFGGQWDAQNVPALTVDNGSATGGTVTVATATAGAAGTYDQVGVLFTSVYVASTSDSDKAIAIADHCVVDEAALPSNHGVTDEFKSAAPLILFR